jgi:hypothetical protein
MLGFLWAGLSSAEVFHVSSLGLNTVRISRSDTLHINLTDRIAVFVSVPPNLYHVANPANQEYYPITIPEFSATGSQLSLRLDSSRTKFKFWLFDASHCPDPTNLAVIHTNHLLHLTSGIDGPACLFFPLGARSYQAIVETTNGFPFISFFSARGRGEPVKVCLGEDDICELGSEEPIFLSFQGQTRVNFSYYVDGLSKSSRHCSIRGIPLLQNGTFVDAAPKIWRMAYPYCLAESNGLIQAGILVSIFSLIVTGCVLVLKTGLEKGGTRLTSFTNGHIAIQIRKGFMKC